MIFALLTACAQNGRNLTDGALSRPNIEVIRAPEKDRCQTLTADEGKRTCEGSRKQAQAWARRLSPGDVVCLDNGIGEEPTADCHARAAVVDAATDRVMLEVVSARPESRWFRSVESRIWFDEGALVDLYLAERGY